MTTFVALLRAVNVGGRSLAMADLRRVLGDLGLADVRTYLQSGNAVFGAEGDADQIAARIVLRIERDLGPRVGVLVLAADDLATIARSNPFAAGPVPSHRATAAPPMDERLLHVTFLFGEPGEADFGEASRAARSSVWQTTFEGLALPAAEGERAVYVGSPPLATPVVYLYLPHGYGRSKLGNAYFERSLGTAATTRNWRTVTALAAMAAGAREEG